jgi:NAD(P)H-hydrate repair Nnr-like enzyme with NAD(P)H-hydrate dehydratase domain
MRRLRQTVYAARSSLTCIKSKASVRRKSAVLAGPGMGTGPEALQVLQEMVAQRAGPLLLDADALTLLVAGGAGGGAAGADAASRRDGAAARPGDRWIV